MAAKELLDHLVAHRLLEARSVARAQGGPPGLLRRRAAPSAASGPAPSAVSYFAVLERVAGGGQEGLMPPVQYVGCV